MKFAAGETSVMLTAGHGDIADIDGLPAAFPYDYTFQWVRVDADGPSNPADINDATSGVYTRADGGLHSVPVSCVLADPRRQPDLAGGVQRGRSECRRGGLRNVRHDGRADRCRGVGASAQYDVTVSGGNLGSLNATVTLSIDEYSATGLPSGLSIDAGTGVIGGTPDTADAGTASATVTVSDAAGNTAEVSITFPAVGNQTRGFEYGSDCVRRTVTAPRGDDLELLRRCRWTRPPR